jgi:phosphoserine phosphatase
MNLVLFDLDNTLLAGDSDYEWGQFLIAKGAVDGVHYEAKNRAFYEDYKAGRLDIYAFLAFALRPLATHTREQLDSWRAEYMETRVKPMITQAARDLVTKHLNEADLVAVITATNSFVTGPIAKEFGIPHLIATDPEEIDGRFTAKSPARPASAKARSSGSNISSKPTAPVSTASTAAGSTAIRTTTCRCWRKSSTPSQSIPIPRCTPTRWQGTGR